MEDFYSDSNLEGGIDEAGRGCLSGPVVSSCVILPKSFNIPVNDSKKLTSVKREKLYKMIIENCISYGIGISYPHEIDEINILQATILSMHRAIDNMKIKPKYLIIDGNYFKKYKNINYKTIIKGDTKYKSIASASIISKVYRDEYMTNLSKKYPLYKWDSNKGYGVKEHINTIKKYGMTEYHRKSFKIKY